MVKKKNQNSGYLLQMGQKLAGRGNMETFWSDVLCPGGDWVHRCVHLLKLSE